MEAPSVENEFAVTEEGTRPRFAIAADLDMSPRLSALALDAIDPDAFLLGRDRGVLDLRPPGEHDRPGVRALFPPDRGGAGPNPLVRAFGPRIQRIHDLTAGLGGDAPATNFLVGAKASFRPPTNRRTFFCCCHLTRV